MYKNPQAIFEDLLLKFNEDYSNIKIITEARLYSQKEWYMASFYIIRKNMPNITVDTTTLQKAIEVRILLINFLKSKFIQDYDIL